MTSWPKVSSVGVTFFELISRAYGFIERLSLHSSVQHITFYFLSFVIESVLGLCVLVGQCHFVKVESLPRFRRFA